MGKYAISFGPGAYGGLDITNGAPLDGWCPQYKLKDFTGLDSLVSPAFSLLLLLLFNLPCMPSGEGWAWGAARPFDAVPVEAQGLGLGLGLRLGSGLGLGLGLACRSDLGAPLALAAACASAHPMPRSVSCLSACSGLGLG